MKKYIHISLFGEHKIGYILWVWMSLFYLSTLALNAQPLNDDCQGAISVTVQPNCFFVSCNNTNATASDISSPGCANYNGGDVWYSFTVPVSGHVIITSQSGSLLDGGMAIYRGTCGSLVLIACDDNNGLDLMPEIDADNLIPNTTIYIRFWENGGDKSGSFGLSVYLYQENPIAADECENAPMICNLNGYNGNTSASYTADCKTCENMPGGKYSNMCQGCNDFSGNIHNNSWITFTAENTQATLQFNVSDCSNHQGIQFGIYSGDLCDNFDLLTPIEFTSGTGNGLGEGSFNIEADSLNIGSVYYIMVDGFYGDVCNYEIKVIDGIAVGQITGNNNICLGQTGTTYTISVNATKYEWAVPKGAVIVSGQNTKTISVDWGSATSGDITCSTTDGICTGIFRTYTVIVNPIPEIHVSNSGPEICTGDNLSLTCSPGGFSSYSWTGPNNFSSQSQNPQVCLHATTNMSGTYMVTVTHNGCINTAETIVTVNNTNTTYNVKGGGFYCEGDNGIEVQISGSETGVNYQLQLNGINIGQAIAGTGNPINFGYQLLEGNYTVLAIHNTTKCTNIMTGNANVIKNELPLPFTVNGGGSYCEGENGIIVSLSGSQIGVIYQLQKNGVNVGNPILGTGNSINFENMTDTGTYIVKALNMFTLCENTMEGFVLIQLYPSPIANAGDDVSICEGETITLTATGGNSYTWNNGVNSNVNMVSPLTSTIYTVTVTNIYHCSNIDHVSVVVKPYSAPEITSSTSLIHCDNLTEPIILTAEVGFASYEWSTGETTQSISVNGIGTFWVIGSVANGCKDTSMVVSVQVFASPKPPTIIPDGPTSFCQGDSISVNLFTDSHYFAYNWASGSLTSSIHVSHTGYYDVTVTDSNGCTSVSINTVHVAFIPKPVAYINYQVNNCLVKFYDFSLDGLYYDWDFGDGYISQQKEPTHMYAKSGTYNVRCIVSNDCGSDTSIVILKIECENGVDDNEHIFNLMLFPNPVVTDLNIQFDCLDVEELEVKVINISGLTLLSQKMINISSTYRKSINMKDLPSGFYIIQLFSEKGTLQRKIFKL